MPTEEPTIYDQLESIAEKKKPDIDACLSTVVDSRGNNLSPEVLKLWAPTVHVTREEIVAALTPENLPPELRFFETSALTDPTAFKEGLPMPFTLIDLVLTKNIGKGNEPKDIAATLRSDLVVAQEVKNLIDSGEINPDTDFIILDTGHSLAVAPILQQAGITAVPYMQALDHINRDLVFGSNTILQARAQQYASAILGSKITANDRKGVAMLLEEFRHKFGAHIGPFRKVSPGAETLKELGFTRVVCLIEVLPSEEELQNEGTLVASTYELVKNLEAGGLPFIIKGVGHGKTGPGRFG